MFWLHVSCFQGVTASSSKPILPSPLAVRLGLAVVPAKRDAPSVAVQSLACAGRLLSSKEVLRC